MSVNCAVDNLLAVHMQQARGAALGQRELRNQFGRQIEIEIGERIHAILGNRGKTQSEGPKARFTIPAAMPSLDRGQPAILR
jgi:hypothetical protein